MTSYPPDSCRDSFACAMPRPTWAWTRTASIAMFGRISAHALLGTRNRSADRSLGEGMRAGVTQNSRTDPRGGSGRSSKCLILWW